MKKSNRNILISKKRRHRSIESIVAYCNMRQEKFLTALSSARTYYSIEGIHDLRVDVKKLRALYNLVEYISPSFSAKSNVAALKELFDAAGRLRDIDIHQASALAELKKYDLREYYNHLKKKELRQRKSFDAISKSFTKTVLTRSRVGIGSALAPLPEEQIRRRMEKNIKKLSMDLITSTGLKRLNDKDLHAIRKTAKTMYYTIALWQQCYGKTSIAKKVSAQLKNSFDRLGAWRDTLLALKSMESFLNHKIEKKPVDPEGYEKFRLLLRRRNKSQLDAFHRKRKSLQTLLGRFHATVSIDK